MEFLGFAFELILLALGVYMYRFAVGKIHFHETQQPLVNRFLKENGTWMRFGGLALAAMMSFEIALHIFQFFKK